MRHSLRANVFERTFLTYTIFENYEALQDLVFAPEHVEAMKRMSEWSGPESRTTNWTAESAEIDWADGRRRLAATAPLTRRSAMPASAT